MENPRILEERIDHAEILDALVELIKHSNESNFRDKLIGFITRQLFELEKINAERAGMALDHILDIYEASVERRSSLGFIERIFSFLGFGKPQEDPAEGALYEMERILSTLEDINRKRIANTVIARLPLLMLMDKSRNGYQEIVTELLRRHMPQEYRGILTWKY